jgi:hypothetical protein
MGTRQIHSGEAHLVKPRLPLVRQPHHGNGADPGRISGQEQLMLLTISTQAVVEWRRGG